MTPNRLLLPLACAVLLLPTLAAADTPYQSACANGAAPPCVNVTLVEKVADVVNATAGFTTPLAYVYDYTGELSVKVDGLPVYSGTFAGAMAFGTPSPATFTQSVGPVTTEFQNVAYTKITTVRHVEAALTPPVAYVWLAHIEIVVSPGVHYVVLAPLVVPA